MLFRLIYDYNNLTSNNIPFEITNYNFSQIEKIIIIILEKIISKH